MTDTPDRILQAAVKALYEAPQLPGDGWDDLAAVVAPVVLMAAAEELSAMARRLQAKARGGGDKTHFATAAGCSLSAVKLIELADKIGARRG